MYEVIRRIRGWLVSLLYDFIAILWSVVSRILMWHVCYIWVMIGLFEVIGRIFDWIVRLFHHFILIFLV